MTRFNLNPAWWLRHRYGVCWWIVFASLLAPAVNLAYLAGHGELGANPLERLERATGRWAFICLTASLAITPVRRLLARIMTLVRASHGKRMSDWNGLIRMRRMVGLVAFAYAASHVVLYLELDLNWERAELLRAIQEKPFIVAGAVAFLIFILLAFTSNDLAVRRMGRQWKRLHRLVYVAAVAACLHFVWMTKPGVFTPYPFVTVMAVLLLYRIAAYALSKFATFNDDGEAVPERATDVVLTNTQKNFCSPLCSTPLERNPRS